MNEQSHFVIREATDQDLPELRSWAELHLMDDESLLTGTPLRMLVAVSDHGAIVAYLLFWLDHVDPGILHIQVLEVHPLWRRQGIGRSMVEAVRQRPLVHGLTAESVQWNAVAFWNAVGCRPDEQEEWIEGEDEHAGDFVWKGRP